MRARRHSSPNTPNCTSSAVASAQNGKSRAIGTKFRNFTVNVGIDELRGVRVYVTGFANNPGAYTVNSLSTMVNAVLAAGGGVVGTTTDGKTYSGEKALLATGGFSIAESLLPTPVFWVL